MSNPNQQQDQANVTGKQTQPVAPGQEGSQNAGQGNLNLDPQKQNSPQNPGNTTGGVNNGGQNVAPDQTNPDQNV